MKNTHVPVFGHTALCARDVWRALEAYRVLAVANAMGARVATSQPLVFEI